MLIRKTNLNFFYIVLIQTLTYALEIFELLLRLIWLIEENFLRKYAYNNWTRCEYVALDYRLKPINTSIFAWNQNSLNNFVQFHMNIPRYLEDMILVSSVIFLLLQTNLNVVSLCWGALYQNWSNIRLSVIERCWYL